MTDVRPAGRVVKGDEGGVAACFGDVSVPTMPANVAMFQSMRSPAVGGRTPKRNDPPLDPKSVYGIKSVKTEAAGQLISPKPLSRFEQAVINSKANAAKMKVNNSAPRVMEFLPSDTIFGVSTAGTEATAKECIWPSNEGNPEDEEEMRRNLYLKSHNATLPGEQKARSYAGGFDGTNVMGKPTPCDAQGGLVAKTFRWRSADDADKNRTESDIYKAFKAGKGQKLPEDTIFGRPSGKDGDSVATLTTSLNPEKDDDIEDLTSSFSGSDSQVFGMPTIRTIDPPGKISVSDKNNYGDQGGAATVLTPSKSTLAGVSVRDMETGRNKEQIKAIFETAKLHETLDFEGVWERAANGSDTVSIAEFQKTLLSR